MEYKLKVAGIILTLAILWFGSIYYALDYKTNDNEVCENLDMPQTDIYESIQDCDIFNMSGVSPEVDDLYIKVDCLKGGNR